MRPQRPRTVAWTARWRPAALGPIDVALSLYAMSVMALVRGFDYGTGNDATGGTVSALTEVEAAAPMWAWSAGFIIGGLLLLLGAVRHWHGVVWLGHGWLGVLYTALAVGVVIPVVGTPWLDGIRAATVLILPMTMHWVLAVRTGPRPLETGHTTATLIAADTQGD